MYVHTYVLYSSLFCHLAVSALTSPDNMYVLLKTSNNLVRFSRYIYNKYTDIIVILFPIICFLLICILVVFFAGLYTSWICYIRYVSWCGGESWVDQRVPWAYIHNVASCSPATLMQPGSRVMSISCPAKTHSCLIN